MKSINVKSNIEKMIKRYGNRLAVAKELDCSIRYVEYMLKGRRVSSALATVIKTKLI
jgi:hypothetical protein